ncbi:MAG: zf-HC2 domain-containing protein [Candidatus Riflebacteria bacterium]|nr:zf-HC2 domain-containing protein [Candidatus Riflebacteria bacterium]
MSASSTNCHICPTEDWTTDNFQEYLDGRLTPPDKLRLERHVLGCSMCKARLESFRRLFSGLDKALEPTEADRPTSAQIARVISQITGRNPEASIRDRNQTAQPEFSFFDFRLNGLLSHWKLAAIGIIIGLAFLSAILIQPHAAIENPASPSTRVATLPNTSEPGVRFHAFTIRGPAGTQLRRIDANADHETPTCPADCIMIGALYQLPADTSATVMYKNVNRLELTRQARFSITASGTRLLDGSMLCDLVSVPDGFCVTTPAGTITAIGTRFRVAVMREGTEVRLEKGVIQVRTPYTNQLLEHPGVITMTPDGKILPGVTTHVEPPVERNKPYLPPSSSDDTGQTAPNMNQGY